MKEPILLDFNIDAVEAFEKLDNILFTSGWNRLSLEDVSTPSETTLLLSLLRSGAIKIGEVSYMPTNEYPDDFRNAAYLLAKRLRKRDADIVFLNALYHFSNFEYDIKKN